jgi:mono/diheme cytochrome c family protein
MIRRAALLVLAAALPAGASACDQSAAFREPQPSWNRMLTQPRIDPYEPSQTSDDVASMRSPPRGTVPHDAPSTAEPPVTRELLELGRARFETFCGACHGVLGDGVSVVATKMVLRPPPSLHDARYAKLAAPALEKIIETGFGLMPSYADALSPHERWAVAHYVKVLQLSRGVRVAELPPSLRAELARHAP